MLLAQRALILTLGVVVACGTVVAVDSSFISSLTDTTQKERAAQLEQQRLQLAHLQREKSTIAHKVIAEEMNLADAAEAFRGLYANDPTYLTRLRGLFPEAREYQLVGLDVLAEVEVRLSDDPEHWETVKIRLERELETGLTKTE